MHCQSVGSLKPKGLAQVQKINVYINHCRGPNKECQNAKFQYEKLKQAMETLNEKYGSNYTPMQHRIWSELHANGMHIQCRFQ